MRDFKLRVGGVRNDSIQDPAFCTNSFCLDISQMSKQPDTANVQKVDFPPESLKTKQFLSGFSTSSSSKPTGIHELGELTHPMTRGRMECVA